MVKLLLVEQVSRVRFSLVAPTKKPHHCGFEEYEGDGTFSTRLPGAKSIVFFPNCTFEFRNMREHGWPWSQFLYLM